MITTSPTARMAHGTASTSPLPSHRISSLQMKKARWQFTEPSLELSHRISWVEKRHVKRSTLAEVSLWPHKISLRNRTHSFRNLSDWPFVVCEARQSIHHPPPLP